MILNHQRDHVRPELSKPEHHAQQCLEAQLVLKTCPGHCHRVEPGNEEGHQLAYSMMSEEGLSCLFLILSALSIF